MRHILPAPPDGGFSAFGGLGGRPLGREPEGGADLEGAARFVAGSGGGRLRWLLAARASDASASESVSEAATAAPATAVALAATLEIAAAVVAGVSTGAGSGGGRLRWLLAARASDASASESVSEASGDR